MNKLWRKIKSIYQDLRHRPSGIQTTILTALTVTTVAISLGVGVLLYVRFYLSNRSSTVENTELLNETVGRQLEEYLYEMRQISDTANYNIIQDKDISDSMLSQELSVLYEANKSKVISIALYNENGSLLLAEPVASQKEDPDVTHQQWFADAMSRIENVHFSTPHVQNLFDDSTYQYHWVISISRSVDITNGNTPSSGVLLVDMDYSDMAEILKNMNQTENGQYYYLCDSDGTIIYHPQSVELSRGLREENSAEVATLSDGIYSGRLNGEDRTLVVDTISYTGWKLVGVIPQSAFSVGMAKIRYYIFAVGIVLIMMLILVNRIVASRISRPILRLDESVKEYETGRKPAIYIGGSSEIRHLGSTVQKSYEEIERLMKEIVQEQNLRRKSEIDALQSQINPHFLYNTLESITWMVEGGRNEEAVKMISELSKLLRISLSKGRTIISTEDELQHIKSYMNIQMVRYKNHFRVEYDIEPGIGDYCTVKLILQPILENAIYYGVGDRDEDDPGLIRIHAGKDDDKLYFVVADNGYGMSEEVVDNLLKDNGKVPKHGNGVGLINVNARIRLIMGKEYGLRVESEPDEGTRVTVCLPAIPYTQENRELLEDIKKREVSNE